MLRKMRQRGGRHLNAITASAPLIHTQRCVVSCLCGNVGRIWYHPFSASVPTSRVRHRVWPDIIFVLYFVLNGEDACYPSVTRLLVVLVSGTFYPVSRSHQHQELCLLLVCCSLSCTPKPSTVALEAKNMAGKGVPLF